MKLPVDCSTVYSTTKEIHKNGTVLRHTVFNQNLAGEAVKKVHKLLLDAN